MNYKKVAVVGLGYVGLPLASLCAKRGYDVVGLEINRAVVEKLKNGVSHIKDETVESLFAEASISGKFTPTYNVSDIKDCDIYLICVPTPIDSNQDPDLNPIISAIEIVSPFLEQGDMLVVESTVFPGTCEEILMPHIEKISQLKPGVDFDVAHCPERVNPGDHFWTTENIPRVVGASTLSGAEKVADFYASILGGEVYKVADIRQSLRPKFRIENEKLHVAQIPLGSVTIMNSIRDAEAVKAMENTVRDVNIAFVNELAKISDVLNLNVVDIIDGMSTKPFGKGPFYPGVGVGGHCIAVDPEWLKAASKKAGYMPEMINLSRMTNNGMPEYTISQLQNSLNECGYPVKNTKIAVLGVAYKKNVDDPRESPFYSVSEILLKKGAVINVFDSWYTQENNVENIIDALSNVKAVVVVTDHDDIVTAISEMDLLKSSIEVIIDGRNCLNAENIKKQGVIYRGIGR